MAGYAVMRSELTGPIRSIGIAPRGARVRTLCYVLLVTAWTSKVISTTAFNQAAVDAGGARRRERELIALNGCFQLLNRGALRFGLLARHRQLADRHRLWRESEFASTARCRRRRRACRVRGADSVHDPRST